MLRCDVALCMTACLARNGRGTLPGGREEAIGQAGRARASAGPYTGLGISGFVGITRRGQAPVAFSASGAGEIASGMLQSSNRHSRNQLMFQLLTMYRKGSGDSLLEWCTAGMVKRSGFFDWRTRSFQEEYLNGIRRSRARLGRWSAAHCTMRFHGRSSRPEVGESHERRVLDVPGIDADGVMKMQFSCGAQVPVARVGPDRCLLSLLPVSGKVCHGCGLPEAECKEIRRRMMEMLWLTRGGLDAGRGVEFDCVRFPFGRPAVRRRRTFGPPAV